MKGELIELTKKTILKYLTEEQIFEKYLGFNPELFKQYVNPLRKDTSPGCSFYYRDSDNRLIFNDFSWGVQWDCFDVVQYDYNCTFPQALEKIANDFGLRNSKLVYTKALPEALKYKEKIENKLRIVRKKQFTNKELKFWNIGGLEVTQEDLEYYKIFSITHLWETTQKGTTEYPYLFNVFAYQFPKSLFSTHYGYTYQIYRPLVDRRKRRFINPPRIKYGDLEFLDRSENYVVITKSKKDAFFLRMLGVNTFFIINEAIYLDNEVIDEISRYEYVFTLFDKDRAGKRASRRYRISYGTIPLMYRKDEGKDTYDTLEKMGKYYMLDLIEYYKNYYNL